MHRLAKLVFPMGFQNIFPRTGRPSWGSNIVSKIFVLSSRFSCSKDLLNCVVEKNDRVSK